MPNVLKIYGIMRKYVGCCILNCFMPSSLLVFLLFAVLLILNLHTVLMFLTLVYLTFAAAHLIAFTPHTVHNFEFKVQSCSTRAHIRVTFADKQTGLRRNSCYTICTPHVFITSEQNKLSAILDLKQVFTLAGEPLHCLFSWV